MGIEIDEWKIIDRGIDVENNALKETIFSLGNGYMGMRGNFEETYENAFENSMDGIYINGFYEKNPIQYGESAYGYAENNEAMLNVTKSRTIDIYIDGEKFSMFSGKLKEHYREMDMKNGILTRKILWTSPKGNEVQIIIRRVVSFNIEHLAAISVNIIPLNFCGKITIVSTLDGRVKNIETRDDPRVGASMNPKSLNMVDKICNEEVDAIIQKTNNTKFTVICAMKNELNCECKYECSKNSIEEIVEKRYEIHAMEGKKIDFYKYISYFTNKDCVEKELITQSINCLCEASNKGFQEILLNQRQYMDEFWDSSDIKIKGDSSIQQGIRFNEFHLLQSVGKNGTTSISAKGLTGEGYGGHYFWDTEIFVLPFFLYTKPQVSRKLLEYRYSLLDSARKRAKEMSFKQGALYSWRTISGDECSAYYPAGTAQYHINADIIYAVKNYFEITKDEDFIVKCGAEMAFETARIWMQLGGYNSKKNNKFCINCVTGPDEYTALVNNNCYTNAMARENLRFAVKASKILRDRHKEEYEAIQNKINLKQEEINSWNEAAENMLIPYDKEMKIHPQDDSFLEKEVWDFENTPKENYPLLLHYHPLVIYRYQVCKQADTVLAEFLLSNEFSNEDKKRDYDYYEKITTHDSSLSTCIYSIMASELGYKEKAYEYFIDTARMDLDNNHNNSQYGVHTACMGGTWMCVVNGFAGLRVSDGQISFRPSIPDKWDSYEFKITINQNILSVKVGKEFTEYTLLKGTEINFCHKDELIILKRNETIMKSRG